MRVFQAGLGFDELIYAVKGMNKKVEGLNCAKTIIRWS